MQDTEIDVSPLLASPGFAPWDCSNSVANLGQNAGKLTWRASQRHASALTSALANLKPGRSAWGRGVHAYGGDCSGLSGDCSGLWGNCSGLSGDLEACGIPAEDRARGVDIASLIAS